MGRKKQDIPGLLPNVTATAAAAVSMVGGKSKYPYVLIGLVLALFQSHGVTSPGECRYQNGSVAEGYLPGEEVSLGPGCGFCGCDQHSGIVYCMMPYCGQTSCVDYQLTAPGCCPWCPNGKNCKTPSGTIISDGVHVMENDSICSCADRDWAVIGGRSGSVLEAVCFPLSPKPELIPPPMIIPPVNFQEPDLHMPERSLSSGTDNYERQHRL